GSAVTVDLIDATGTFRGGVIFPGLRLMAHALHEHTALLPLVAVDRLQEPPGTTTVDAIRSGIAQAVLGGVQRTIACYRARFAPTPMSVFVTGGDGPLLNRASPPIGELWPEMTL